MSACRLALEYAAASYADDPLPCLSKHNASLVDHIAVSCDAIRDKVNPLLYPNKPSTMRSMDELRKS